MYFSFSLGDVIGFFLPLIVLVAVGLLAGFTLGIALIVERVPVVRRVLWGVAAAYLISLAGFSSWYSWYSDLAIAIPVTFGLGALLVGLIIGATASALGLGSVADSSPQSVPQTCSSFEAGAVGVATVLRRTSVG